MLQYRNSKLTVTSTLVVCIRWFGVHEILKLAEAFLWILLETIHIYIRNPFINTLYVKIYKRLQICRVPSTVFFITIIIYVCATFDITTNRVTFWMNTICVLKSPAVPIRADPLFRPFRRGVRIALDFFVIIFLNKLGRSPCGLLVKWEWAVGKGG